MDVDVFLEVAVGGNDLWWQSSEFGNVVEEWSGHLIEAFVYVGSTPENGVLVTRYSSRCGAVSNHASSAPTESTPAYIPSSCHRRIQGFRSLSRVDAQRLYSTGKISNTR